MAAHRERLVAALGCALLLLTAWPAAGGLRAGTGEAGFDLPAGVSLAGYGGGGRRRPLIRCRRQNPYAHLFKASVGRLDRIGTRALVLELGGRRVALVATELVGVSAEMQRDLAARVADLEIAPEALFLAATHTHSGPGGFARPKLWQLAAADKFVPELYDRYLRSMEDAVRAAAARLEPARLAVGAGRIEGVTANRREPENPLDPVATLVRIDAPNGAPLTAIVAFPIHPTVLGGDNLLVSGDVAGSIARRLQRRIGAPALFFNGALGDVRPLAEGGDPVAMEELGEKIAVRAHEIWEELEPRAVERIDTARFVQAVGRPRLNLAACLGWKKRSGKWTRKLASPPLPDSAPLAGLRIDGHVFVSVPGEPIAELGLEIKRRAGELGFTGTTVLGLANEHLGYVLTAEEYAKGGYEACASLHGAGLGDDILAGAERVLKALAE